MVSVNARELGYSKHGSVAVQLSRKTVCIHVFYHVARIKPFVNTYFIQLWCNVVLAKITDAVSLDRLCTDDVVRELIVICLYLNLVHFGKAMCVLLHHLLHCYPLYSKSNILLSIVYSSNAIRMYIKGPYIHGMGPCTATHNCQELL
jgi:hypothetical protein